MVLSVAPALEKPFSTASDLIFLNHDRYILFWFIGNAVNQSAAPDIGFLSK